MEKPRDAIVKSLIEQNILCQFVSLGIPNDPICNKNKLDFLTNYEINRESINSVSNDILYKKYSTAS